MVSKQISEDANAELKSSLDGLCESMKDVKGILDSFRCEMKGDVNEVEGTMDIFRGELEGDVKNLGDQDGRCFW